MPFTVRPCFRENLSTCCSIQWQASARNPLLSLIYPNGGTEALQNNITYHLHREYLDNHVQMFCVVDTSVQDKLIACVRWTVMNGHQSANVEGGRTIPSMNGKPSSAADSDSTVEQDIRSPSTTSEGTPATPSPSAAPPVPPEDTNGPLFSHFISAISSLRSAHQPHQTVVLDDLSVIPEHQWQGAGKLLLRKLIDFADARNLPCYIESTPVAYNMYIHQGFREVDKLDIDLGKWRPGYAVYRTSLLYRDAQA
ncbi:MAG: hypothetical protein Q9221_002013 [Calogaya cf. arnoldii]